VTIQVELADGRPPVLDATQQAGNDGPGWLGDHRDFVDEIVLQHGCVLLRGPFSPDVDTFAASRNIVLSRLTRYREKATPRTELAAGVMSSTDLPPSQAIDPHNENSYTLEFPGRLVFGCVRAPRVGGATTVVDVRAVLTHLPVEVASRFATAGWLLVRNYVEHAGLAWQEAFATADPGAVESYCAANAIGCRWSSTGELRTAQKRPAIITHPQTREQVWFNHLAFWNEWALDEETRDVLIDTFGEDGLPFNTYAGDGARVTRSDVDAIRSAYSHCTMREAWQPGDILVVDNILCAHGRDAYEGERQIVVAMGDAVALSDCSPTPAADASAWPTHAHEAQLTPSNRR
jgi:alpha-ketoglutarate-dependent taurine dioxygenase